MAKKKSRRTRSNGEGTIIQLPNGKWKALISFPGPDGKLKRKSKTCKSRSDATIALRKLLNEKDQGTLLLPSTITLKQLVDDWLENNIKGEMAGNTYIAYSNTLNNHVLPRIGHIKLKDLKQRHIQTFLNEMKKDGIGSSTRNRSHSLLVQVLNVAVAMGDIAVSPIIGVPKPKHKTRPANPFTLEETKLILNHTEGSWNHAIYYLAFATGMRQAEIFGLEWKAIDFKKQQLSVHQQLVEEDHEKVLKDKLKNDYSRRKIDLNDSCIEVLHQHRKMQMKKLGKQDFVFLTTYGNWITKSSLIYREWKPLLELLGIDKRGLHQTRHTYATLQLTAGVPVHIVAKILGHANASTLLKTYAHVLEGAQEKATSSIESMLG